MTIKELIASKLRPVANAIRTKKHTSDLIPIDNYEEEILSIEPIYDTITLTNNGEHDVKDYKSAVVSVAGDDAIKLINGTIEGPLDLSDVTIREQFNFANCYNLKGIVLPENLQELSGNFLLNCWYCGDLDIPDSVKNIHANALASYGANLEKPVKIYFPPVINYVYSQSPLPNCHVYFKGTLSQYLAINYPNWNFTLASLSDEFYLKNSEGGYDKVETFVIPEGTTWLKYGLNGTTCFKNVVFPESLTTLSQYAFYNTKGIGSLTIPKTITSIEKQSLYLTPNEKYAGTSKATIIMESATPATLDSNVFNTSYLNKIFVPVGARETYISATNWSSYANYIVEPNSIVLSIPETLLNNENYTYSVDNEENYQQFTSSVISLENISIVKFKNLDANTTILIGTTEGGSDVGTIANAELTYVTSGDATVYLTVQE